MNPEKQVDHMESMRKLGKSYFYDNVNPQDVVDKYADMVELIKTFILTKKE
ncbi:polymorphic toxin type 50 domain-containing protein [Ligilactobacillus pabuli]|nr:polymorphic toxin type 50 domain-containing protein [Ligilactobacillus pabuli]